MSKTHGLLAEFDNADALIAAVKQTRKAGYARYEAFCPFFSHELREIVPEKEDKIDPIILTAGVAIAAAFLFFLWWMNVVDYPINVGGRPLAAWPAFVLPVFEVATAGATIVAVAAFLLLCRLPSRHPVMRVPSFHLASDDKFFLYIEARDEKFDPQKTRNFMEELEPVELIEVET